VTKTKTDMKIARAIWVPRGFESHPSAKTELAALFTRKRAPFRTSSGASERITSTRLRERTAGQRRLLLLVQRESLRTRPRFRAKGDLVIPDDCSRSAAGSTQSCPHRPGTPCGGRGTRRTRRKGEQRGPLRHDGSSASGFRDRPRRRAAPSSPVASRGPGRIRRPAASRSGRRTPSCRPAAASARVPWARSPRARHWT
jgi:hypothetical protein